MSTQVLSLGSIGDVGCGCGGNSGMSGLGALGVLPRFEMKDGIAVPIDAGTLGVFQGLQRALNAWLEKYQPGSSPIGVDGRIGPATFGVTLAVLSNIRSALAVIRLIDPPASVTVLASEAQNYGSFIAEAAGTSWNPSPVPVTKEDREIVAEGVEVTIRREKDSFFTTRTVVATGLLLLAGGVLWRMHRRGEF